MIASILDLLIGCSHRRLTRPVTPVDKAGVPQGGTYVVCLDCAQQFEYDFQEMRIGKRIDHLKDSGVLHPEMPIHPRKKLKYALLVSVPVALLAGLALKSKKRSDERKPESVAEPERRS